MVIVIEQTVITIGVLSYGLVPVEPVDFSTKTPIKASPQFPRPQAEYPRSPTFASARRDPRSLPARTSPRRCAGLFALKAKV